MILLFVFVFSFLFVCTCAHAFTHLWRSETKLARMVLWFELRSSRMESYILNFSATSPTRESFFFNPFPSSPKLEAPRSFSVSHFLAPLFISSTFKSSLLSLPIAPLYFAGFWGYILTSENLHIISRCSTHQCSFFYMIFTGFLLILPWLWKSRK